MSGTIIKASVEDFEELTAIWETSVRATHHFLAEQDIQFFRPLVLQDYLPQLKVFFMKYTGDEIAGFTALSEDKIEMLFVKPEYFGRGVGNALLRFAVETMGVKKVDVNEQNLSATCFYQKMGFVITGRSETDGMGKPFPLLFLQISEKIQIKVNEKSN